MNILREYNRTRFANETKLYSIKEKHRISHCYPTFNSILMNLSKVMSFQGIEVRTNYGKQQPRASVKTKMLKASLVHLNVGKFWGLSQAQHGLL